MGEECLGTQWVKAISNIQKRSSLPTAVSHDDVQRKISEKTCTLFLPRNGQTIHALIASCRIGNTRTFSSTNRTNKICYTPSLLHPVASISTTWRTTKTSHVASASPHNHLKPQWFVSFTALQCKRTEYWNAIKEITNRTNIRLNRQISNHNHNFSHD